LLLGFGNPLCAQQRPPHFEFGHIREQDGLSLRSITGMVQDRDGYLWLGTSNGLYRYDGTHLAHWRKQRNNPNSLLNNQLYSLCEDQQGQIWATFENGISCYNKSTGRFRHLTTVDNQPLGICKNIRCDRAGNVWFTSRNRGLFRYVPETGAAEYFPCYPSDSTGGVRTLPNGLLEDPFRPGLWVAERQGIRYFDTKRRQYSSHRMNPRNQPVFTPNNVSGLALDGDLLLIGDITDRSILVYDLRNERIVKRIRPQEPADRDEFEIATIVVDRQHNLWVSTWNAKSYYVDSKTEQVIELGYDKIRKSTALGSDFIWAGWQHPDGSIWLGTVNGIAHTNPERALYDIYDLEALFPALTDERGIITFAEDSDGSWWLGTSIRGLMHYVPTTGQLNVYPLPHVTELHPWGLPISGLHTYGNQLFVGSDTTVYVFNKKDRKFRTLALPVQAQSVALRTFRLVSDRYWVFGDGKKAFAYDIPLQQWQTYPIRSENSDPRFLVRQTLLDRQGQLWLDIYPEGFARFSAEQDGFLVTDTRQTEYENTISSLAEAPDGSFLMATEMDGLVQYDPVRGKDWVPTENESMALSQCTAARPDRLGNVWVAKFNTFSVITQPEKQVLNFRLPINTHTIEYDTYLFPMRNGHLLSAQKGYLVEFKPEHLQLPRTREKVLLNRLILPDTTRLLYGDSTQLDLEAEDNSFTVEFSVLSATKHRYQFQLEGYDEGWQESTSPARAVYSKLPGGNYTFKVKAITPEGYATPVRTLSIHIDTPFYRAAWFWLLVLFTGLGLLFGFFRFKSLQTAQIYRLQMQATRLERDKTQIQYQNLINHLNPHFLFNSLTSLNSLIISKPKEASVFLKKLSVIYRYILQNKDKELVSLKDELAFAQNYIDLQTARFGDGLQIGIHVAPDLLIRFIVPVTIQNLLENAIKHNIIDEENPLCIRIYTEEDSLYVMNTLQKKGFVETSHKQGLAGLQSLYRYLSQRPIRVIETATHFTVAVPLL
jgi:ligand-binding sensor domain-containing protein